ncbi:LOW QUALITY PROTEIN: hypothetical protein HZS_1257 [Henneguya salminicola]|nr:LOW QUALITY PROTEIN: hypothetical protein HZS_1257 [Henneguya salminicola]
MIFVWGKADVLFSNLNDKLIILYITIINGLANLAIHYSSEVLIWLYNWHRSQIPDDLEKIQSLYYLSQSRDPFLHLRFCEICDASYLLCFKEILASREKPLEKPYIKTNIAMIYKILRERYTILQTSQKKENINYINKIVCSIMDSVASKNLPELEQLFFTEVDLYQSTHIQCMLILTTRNIHVKVFSIDHVEGVFSMLNNCGKRLLKTKDKEVKFAFITTISEILLSFADVAKTELNIPVVKSFVESLNSYSNDLLKKGKYSHISLPLSTALLCCSNRKAFFTNYFSFITNLINFTKLFRIFKE